MKIGGEGPPELARALSPCYGFTAMLRLRHAARESYCPEAAPAATRDTRTGGVATSAALRGLACPEPAFEVSSGLRLAVDTQCASHLRGSAFLKVWLRSPAAISSPVDFAGGGGGVDCKFCAWPPAEWPNCAWGFEVVAPENTVAFDIAVPIYVARTQDAL
jgi:hypothetical protein